MLLGLSITVSKHFGQTVRVKTPGQTMLIKLFLEELCANIFWLVVNFILCYSNQIEKRKQNVLFHSD